MSGSATASEESSGLAPEAQIGERIRRARLARGKTIDAVASAAGLTKGFVSRLERDRVSASVASLVRVCAAIGIPVGSLFEAAETGVVRSDQAPAINFGGSGVSDRVFTPASERQLQVIHSRIEPGGSSGPEQYGLSSRSEFVYVLTGALELEIGEQSVHLAEGDAVTFAPSEPHSWRCPPDQSGAEVLWVLSPAA